MKVSLVTQIPACVTETYEHPHAVHEGKPSFVLLVELGEYVLEQLRMEAAFLVVNMCIAAVF